MGGGAKLGSESGAAAKQAHRVREEAAGLLQKFWRGSRKRGVWVSTIERGWVGRHAKQLGSLEAHVRFLQRTFRATVGLRAGCWSAGQLRVPFRVFRSWGRRGLETRRCGGGANLASQEEFDQQRALSEEMLDWYSTYVALLRRLRSGVTPFVLQNFCGGGGSSEGTRRAGGASHGLDLFDQPDYRRRFGDDSFTRCDGTSWASVKALKARTGAFGQIGGPPCKFYSKARVRGEATQPPLINTFRDECVALFGIDGWWAIENVMGAALHMSANATMLDGALFGLRVARARLYETNFELHVDECVRGPARELAKRCCLGRRRRFRRFDEFGRPEKGSCCCGNIFAVQGTTPWRSTADECAEAMGVDVGHMGYERLAQSVPPAYGQFVFSQMCMQEAHAKFGVPRITFDEYRARPHWARRTMAFWLRGAGAPDASAGQLFAPGSADKVVRTGGSGPGGRESREAAPPKGRAFVREAEMRELYYSHAGGYSQAWSCEGHGSWLSRVSGGRGMEAEPEARDMIGTNTIIDSRRDGPRFARAAVAAVNEGGAGTRVTIVTDARHRAELEGLGFEHLPCHFGKEPGDRLESAGLVSMCIGRRMGVVGGVRFDHESVREKMDWRDRGGHEADPVEKARLTWQDFPHDPERYRGKGLPPWVEKMMTEGAVIDADAQVLGREVGQYAWPDGNALVEAIMETDRHLAIGALEYVPDDEVRTVIETCVIHPLLLVAQGKGKFRACHDYSVGTNRVATSSPFSLPSVWDARAAIKPGSYMCKYDLRDGFFAVPVHPESRNRLVVRHPASGRLLRAARLPFGYVDSPRLFCGLTEAIADEVRRRVAGQGVSVFVFVDDFLVVGDDERAARLGGETLEQVLFEFGIPWAPHKFRGPARCMEFLGLLISNAPGHRCVALSEKRQKKLRAQIDEWRSREPSRVGIGAAPVTVDAKELASFLGHLIFCAQVVPHGRVYMMSMLSQFSGLVVDWRRGEVRPAKGSGAWTKGVTLQPGFWRDLSWWHERFESQNCTPLDAPARGEVALCGTDASDWGTGQLMWEDGLRAEAVLEFTDAERARSINWRELLGIVRVLEQFGEELRGRSLLIEGDNTASLSAAEKESSKAEGSQELVRRLVELAERCELTLRFTHTPGVKLIRPDQTSRGDPMEEPRARLRRADYDLLAARFGPFTEWLGAERRFGDARKGEEASGAMSDRLWVHPSHSTVGSAMRRLGERLGERGGTQLRGVVIVPHDERAKWWQLVRHFRIEGRWPAGSSHLELNQLGNWVETKSERPTLILSFPRSVGSATRPVIWREASEPSEGYVVSEEAESRHVLPLPVGAFVYSRGVDGATHRGEGGELMVVWQGYDPTSEGRTSFDGDEPTVQTVEMLHEGRGRYSTDSRGPGVGSFAGSRFQPWNIHARVLYEVGHLVEVKTQMDTDKMGKRGQAARLTWGAVKGLTVHFDWKRAEAEIAAQEPRAPAAGSGAFPEASDPPDQLEEAIRGLELEEDSGVALGAARVSAMEAVAARRRDAVTHVAAAEKGKGAAGVGAQWADPGVLICKSATMTCESCHGIIGWGKRMVAGGRGMCHANGLCPEEADAHLAFAVKEGKERPMFPQELGTGSLKRHVQTSHRLSDERVGMVLRCLDGECGCTTETRLPCVRGCGRSVHPLSCCSFSSGVAALGNVVCAYCRGADLVVTSCTPPKQLVRRMVEAMVIEATTGKATTHAGFSDLASLERKFQVSVAGDEMSPQDVRLPHTSAEGCYAFCLWLSGDGPRSRSMGNTLKQMSAFCEKLKLTNHAKSARVKALLKELEATGAAITTPDTQVTSLMIHEMYGAEGTIAACCSKVPAIAEVMTARETVLQDFELVGGFRVGEVCGGGDGHGLLAVHVCIQRVAEGTSVPFDYGETIEAKIEDSKTGFQRWTVFAGETEKTHIKTAEHLRKWWSICGYEVRKEQTGAFVEERADYWVVRVSLLDMSADVFKAFLKDVEWATSVVIIAHRKASLKYAKDRKLSKTLGEEMRYVNVAGGPRAGYDIAEAVSWLNAKGYQRYTDVVHGPFIRATFGHSLCHMPYSPGSTHVHLVPAMRMAFDRVNAAGVVDPEYDVTSDPIPKFANHSNRRHADRVAMRNQAVTKVTDQDIDFFFGWRLKKMKESMRLHYAGMDRLIRLGLSMVTRMM